jgi:hypothetical protein
MPVTADDIVLHLQNALHKRLSNAPGLEAR